MTEEQTFTTSDKIVVIGGCLWVSVMLAVAVGITIGGAAVIIRFLWGLAA